MDYARKIGKSDEPKKLVRQPPSSITVFDQRISVVETPPTEDPRLVNWRKWLANRRKQCERIQSYRKDKRRPLLDSSDKVRPLIEMRNLMDYANVPVPVIPDKYRGGPEFWRTPLTLSNRGDVCLPDVSVTPSKKDLNVAPELTYVGLPELIKKEKDLIDLESEEPRWKHSEYLKRRKQELRREIELLILKEPEMGELLIEGRAPRQKEKPPRIPPITISTADEYEDESAENPDIAIALKIQDREIVWKRSAFDETTPHTHEWNLTFSGEIDRRSEKTIVFENKGNRVILYQWRDASFKSDSLHFERRTSPFYFNKTKSVILPGQIAELKVWHLPRIYGVFSETWHLVTDPKLCPSPLTFRFWGCARSIDPGVAELSPSRSIDRYLDHCIRASTIREILNDIVEDIDLVQPPEPHYGSLFLEGEIFTSKNPLCHYHPSLVIELRRMYRAVTNQNSRPWNLSLDHLRETLLRIGKPEHRNEMLSQFGQFYKKLLEPTLRGSMGNDKHETVRNMLCCFANQFETESEHARSTSLLRECKESGVTEIDCSRLTSVSQVSVKSNSSRARRGKRSSALVQNNQLPAETRNSVFDGNPRPYGEVFFIRIHELLSDTIDRICAIVDSFDRLREGDK